MDALDRILPLAGLLWPTLDCDVSIRRDPERVTSAGAVYLAWVFDLDHPDGSAALPLADASGATPTEAAEALAAQLADLARPRLAVLLRAAGAPAPDASTRADLADDVARLERAVADLTRQRDGALGVALHTAGERDRAISELGVVRGENQRLRGQLEAAHRAAGEGVDLAAADVAIEGVLARAGCSLALRGRLRPELLCAVREHLRSEHVESGEAEGVEGGGHETSVDPAAHCRKSRAEVTS